MKIGFWKIQTDIEKAFKKRGCKTIALDWHKSDWQKQFKKANCDAYVWYPHLHHQWFKLLDRAGFVEIFMNKKIFPSLKTSFLFQDKMHQKYAFDFYKIPAPKTTILTTPSESENFFKKTKYPVLIKDIWGFGGEAPKNKIGIVKIENKKQADDFLKKKKWPAYDDQINQDDYLYAQEFIKIASEFRIITVGQKILLAYEKKSEKLLKHVWRGAEVNWQVDKKIKEFIKKINKKLRLDWCGWDVIKDQKGKLMMLEINPIFGTKTLEQQNINLADYLTEYVINQFKKNGKKN